MNKSENFKQVFGIYAEEFWAKPEREMLEWIAEEAEERTAKVENIEDPAGLGAYGDCSECGGEVTEQYTYCPNCGAKLDWSWNE